MADPKYANLPGIAYDQPDVYETSDLPEADQKDLSFDTENDPVENLHVSVNDAFNKFKDKSLDSRSVDFSDRISRRIRTGYDARSGDWELMAEGEKETPTQKFQRLQCELKQLLEEVSENKVEEVKGDSPEVTSEKIDLALKQLYEIKLEDALGTDSITNLADPQGSQINKLFSQLENFKQFAHPPAKDSKTTAASSQGDHITYQLQFKPDQTRFEQTTRLSDLEIRLKRLESLLGDSSEKLARLATATQTNTLYDAAQDLSAKASLLDSAQLDHIEGRLTALQQKMNSIAEKKDESTEEDAVKDHMIIELYDLIKASENSYKLVPETIERLVALEALHSRATEFSKSLTQLEALQGQISAGVLNNKTLLQGVQESFAQNLDSINKTIQNLDGRIQALQKK